MDRPCTYEQALDWAARRLARHALFYGHGTTGPEADAVLLLAAAVGEPVATVLDDPRHRLDSSARHTLAGLVARRIRERRPAAYLARRALFAGLEFYVDERVLVPRSPVAELIAEGFAPWIEEDDVHRVLDLGTGSGCLAIASALRFPAARVEAVDIDRGALEVAAVNVAAFDLGERIELLESDHFSALAGRRYDVILSNPPYVPRARLEQLPPEYGYEPAGALAAGADGLASVRRILHDAARFMTDDALLVVEVGEIEQEVAAAYPGHAFTWLEMEHGGGGVFLISRRELLEAEARTAAR